MSIFVSIVIKVSFFFFFFNRAWTSSVGAVLCSSACFAQSSLVGIESLCFLKPVLNASDTATWGRCFVSHAPTSRGLLAESARHLDTAHVTCSPRHCSHALRHWTDAPPLVNFSSVCDWALIMSSHLKEDVESGPMLRDDNLALGLKKENAGSLH